MKTTSEIFKELRAGATSGQLDMIEELDTAHGAIMVACQKSLLALCMLPSRDYWNPEDAADFFSGMYGERLRELVDEALASIRKAHEALSKD